MITQKTVLILGAGASMPYGFPSGIELRDYICSMEIQQIQTIEQLGFKRDEIKEFIRVLEQSRQPSVDAFLEHRSEYLEVGRASIAYFLILKEREQNLTIKIKGVEPSWYEWLLNNKLGDSFEDFLKNRLTIITFNYDRSLEHFLFTSLKSRYNKNDSEVSSALQRVPIIHVHGQLGFLPWQKSGKSDPMRDFTPITTIENLRIGANGIKIITESALDASHDFQSARDAISKSDLVFYFGFGFHKENMRRLSNVFEDDKVNRGGRYVAGTCLGLTEAEKGKKENTYHNHIRMKDETILEFMRNSPQFLGL